MGSPGVPVTAGGSADEDPWKGMGGGEKNPPEREEVGLGPREEALRERLQGKGSRILQGSSLPPPPF